MSDLDQGTSVSAAPITDHPGTIEPEAHNQFSESQEPHTLALLSIAISLKRIADALHYAPAGDANIYDFMREIAARNF